jgi:hypothetical protein
VAATLPVIPGLLKAPLPGAAWPLAPVGAPAEAPLLAGSPPGVVLLVPHSLEASDNAPSKGAMAQRRLARARLPRDTDNDIGRCYGAR